MKINPFVTVLLLALCSCGSPSTPDGKTTTKLDAVEVQPGTISDSMIILDDSSSDGTAVDNSSPSPSTKDDSIDEANTGDTDDSSDSKQEARISDPEPTPKKVETKAD